MIFSQIIEKRRRDRINNSLSELRRLVPSAYEKQVREVSQPNEQLTLRKAHLKSVGLLKSYLFHFLSSLKGSAKLEKAEILQMTVDHLKMLHAAGGKGTLINFKYV